MLVKLEDIFIVSERRVVDPKVVDALAESMSKIGLQTPITVREVPNVYEDGEDLGCGLALVAGKHRLEAARLLGWERIECREAKFDDIQARRWEISENLHRAELTELERAEQTNEWRELLLAEKVVQVAPPGGKQKKDRGHRETAKELGTTRDTVRRSEQIANLSPEAKQAAIDKGLDNNQSALLKAAKERTPEAQVISLQQRRSPDRSWRNSFEKLWNAASDEDRAWAREWIDRKDHKSA